MARHEPRAGTAVVTGRRGMATLRVPRHSHRVGGIGVGWEAEKQPLEGKAAPEGRLKA